METSNRTFCDPLPAKLTAGAGARGAAGATRRSARSGNGATRLACTPRSTYDSIVVVAAGSRLGVRSSVARGRGTRALSRRVLVTGLVSQVLLRLGILDHGVTRTRRWRRTFSVLWVCV